MLNYPLTLKYKFFTIGRKITVTDAQGSAVFFIEMKNFKLKEDIRVYNSPNKEQELFTIKADRIIDFSAKYLFSSHGRENGSIRRKGMKSFWIAYYEILDSSEMVTHVIEEENPLIKLVDGLINIIPFGELFTGFFLHPSYSLYATGSDKTQPILRLKKQSSFLEAAFKIEKLRDVTVKDLEERMLQALMTVVLLEKMRG